MSNFVIVFPFYYPEKYVHLHFETNSLILFQVPFGPASFLRRHLLHPFPLLYFLNLSSLQEKKENNETHYHLLSAF